jgi:hypothetical protein
MKFSSICSFENLSNNSDILKKRHLSGRDSNSWSWKKQTADMPFPNELLVQTMFKHLFYAKVSLYMHEREQEREMRGEGREGVRSKNDPAQLARQ